jgi:hypothetical protein
MKFKLRESNGKEIDTTGTSLIDEISISFKKLCETFGTDYSRGDGYKVDAEWSIKFPDRKVATIYNWKDGKNYKGAQGLELEEITNWHIGGKDPIVAERIREILGLK